MELLKHWTLTDLKSRHWLSLGHNSHVCARTTTRSFVRLAVPPDVTFFAHGRAVLRARSARLGRTVQTSALVRWASESE